VWSEVLATGRPVDAIALNAGIGTGGDFARETDLNTELRIIDLNVRSTVHLAKLVSKQMVENGAGRILITASIAGTMPTPLQAVYGATKAFDLEFAQSRSAAPFLCSGKLERKADIGGGWPGRWKRDMESISLLVGPKILCMPQNAGVLDLQRVRAASAKRLDDD
jgi:hypothetical protein